MIQTYQAKLSNIPLNHKLTSDMYLSEYGRFFGELERRLFVQSHIKGISTTSLKKTFSKQFGITARQFNSLRIQLDGKVSSILEKRKIDIQELETKIAYLQKVIVKKTTQKNKLLQKLLRIPQTSPAFSKQRKKYRNLKTYLHQKKRRLRNVQHKLETLKSDELNHKIRICFGSRKLFHKQFHLEENKYKNHGEWKEKWVESRTSQFLVVGSKDETFGNQSATYDLQNVLRLRVANHFVSKYGKYIIFPEVHFPYGQETIDQAKIPYMGYTRGGKPQKYYSSITYRFLKQKKGWYVNTTVEKETPKIGTSNLNGLIGIDLNAGFLSICEIDRFGNPIKSWAVDVPMNSRSKEQIKASLSDALKEILAYAVLVQKDVVIEQLDFSKKKAILREMGPNYARMLSGLAYSFFQQLIDAKGKKAGIRIRKVNPAYTSQIGQMKFMARYGLSSHGSAACMIARRGYYFKTEKPKYDSVLSFPKKFDKQKSNFSNWRSLTKHWRKTYHFQDKIELLKADI
ncbi:IS200/IS605 family accessory protein TnpB-related protein [Neobacillus niacini]|uniref:IS200/IS605 family accessory protein TnpB-related protein n=1 Tax=Neobacillus niacini TaxID=86668 RepID=UPI0021CAF4FA|nr:IS200/IS605 family accessory protein TnpB-related protein [Neobacillus niacini]MCM3767805.1 IS200/IS605 family accessory protein TnpB-related protein [Neobacillus niacini]